jgi:hypothetical protein
MIIVRMNYCVFLNACWISDSNSVFFYFEPMPLIMKIKSRIQEDNKSSRISLSLSLFLGINKECERIKVLKKCRYTYILLRWSTYSTTFQINYTQIHDAHKNYEFFFFSLNFAVFPSWRGTNFRDELLLVVIFNAVYLISLKTLLFHSRFCLIF